MKCIAMNELKIEPQKVTKPIQLLAAWLVGLVLTNSTFLLSATQMAEGSWQKGALVISAIVNVPIFLIALFVLQTRFRAELQEDTYYSEYLSKKTSAAIRIDTDASQDAKLHDLEKRVANLTEQASSVREPSKSDAIDWFNWPVALNQKHPRFMEIRSALREAGIPLATIFGNQENIPKKWIVSLSYQLPFSHTVKILQTVLAYGFDGIQFWTPQQKAGEDEDVYIGSYGDGSYAQITDQLFALLKTEIEPVDLRFYYTQHMKPG